MTTRQIEIGRQTDRQVENGRDRQDRKQPRPATVSSASSLFNLLQEYGGVRKSSKKLESFVKPYKTELPDIFSSGEKTWSWYQLNQAPQYCCPQTSMDNTRPSIAFLPEHLPCRRAVQLYSCHQSKNYHEGDKPRIKAI
jgi:hypothetical protein